MKEKTSAFIIIFLLVLNMALPCNEFQLIDNTPWKDIVEGEDYLIGNNILKWNGRGTPKIKEVYFKNLENGKDNYCKRNVMCIRVLMDRNKERQMFYESNYSKVKNSKGVTLIHKENFLVKDRWVNLVFEIIDLDKESVSHLGHLVVEYELNGQNHTQYIDFDVEKASIGKLAFDTVYSLVRGFIG